jgi:hypothetical protein
MYDEIDVYGVFVYWMMLDFHFNFMLGVPLGVPPGVPPPPTTGFFFWGFRPPHDGFGVGVPLGVPPPHDGVLFLGVEWG